MLGIFDILVFRRQNKRVADLFQSIVLNDGQIVKNVFELGVKWRFSSHNQ